MSTEVTYEKLKEEYIKTLNKNKQLKLNLEKSINNINILKAAVSERDEMIQVRCKSIEELLESKDIMTRRIQAQESKIIKLESDIEVARQENKIGDSQVDESAQYITGELASAFNSERRVLIQEKTDLEKQLGFLSQSLSLKDSELEKAYEKIRLLEDQVKKYSEVNSSEAKIPISENLMNGAPQGNLLNNENESNLLQEIANKEKIIEKLKEELLLFNMNEGEKTQELENRLITMEEKLKSFISSDQEKSQIINDIKKTNKEQEDLLLEEKTRYSQLQSENAYLENQLALFEQCRSRCNDLDEQNRLLTNTIEEMKRNVIELSESKLKCEELNCSLKEMTSNFNESLTKITQLSDQNMSLLTNIEVLKNVLDNNQKETKNLKEKLQEGEKYFNQNREFQDKIVILLEEKDVLDRGISSKTEEILLLKSKIEESDKNISELSRINGEFQIISKRYVSENEIMKSMVNEKDIQIQNLKKQSDLDKESYERLESKLNEIIRSLQDSENKLNNSLNQVKNGYKQSQIMNEELLLNKQHLDSQLKEYEKQCETYEHDLESLNEKILMISNQSNEEQIQIQKLKKSRDKMESQKRNCEKQIHDLETEINKLKSQIEGYKKDTKGSSGSENCLFPDYLRRVLLQFFMQEGTTRESLIPIILRIVQCDEKQITAAQRRWADSTQIISQALSVFRNK